MTKDRTPLEMLFSTLFLVVYMVTAIASLSGCQKDNGIIILEGYGEAVAFCDGGGDHPPEPIRAGWNTFGVKEKRDGILMIINEGWEHHPSNETLFKLAVEKCRIH